MAAGQEKPHAVCIPYPAQGHITPMLNLAKLLHSRYNFHITFVNNEHNHRRLLRSQGQAALDVLPSFRFEAIPDGLPPSDPDATQHIPSLSYSVSRNLAGPFKDLVRRLNTEKSPMVSLVVSDCSMNFTLDVAEEMGIPVVLLWTSSACSFLGYAQYRRLIDQGIVPLKDSTFLTNGYLEEEIDWIPSMKGIRLRNLPSFVRTTDPNDAMLNILMHRVESLCKATAPTIFHTFDALDHDILEAISAISHSPVCPIGPLQLQVAKLEHDDEINSMSSNLWKEDSECLQWLHSKEPNSVLYINFGSVAVIEQKNVLEIAWGLAESECNFLWILRRDLINGGYVTLPLDFMEKTRSRGFIASWCDQMSVLRHPSIGGFLTHCGWNSVLDSLCNGVPLICWPFFADQMTNSWFCCQKWGVGMEMEGNVRRNQVEWLVREVIGGEKGKEMKKRAMEWKNLAEEATQPAEGSSCLNLDKLVNQVLIQTP